MGAKSREEDYAGKKYNHLTILGFTGEMKHGTICTCQCDCGTIKNYNLSKVKRGESTNCGCIGYKRMIEKRTKHGLWGTRLYMIYYGMEQRCFNPDDTGYENYGGRGIKVCEEWTNNFQAFCDWAMANGYAEDLTIERKDVNGDYCPENCKWATTTEQARNKRLRTDNVSGVKGVQPFGNTGKWRARIGVNHKEIPLGLFDTIEEAAAARKAAEAKYW